MREDLTRRVALCFERHRYEEALSLLLPLLDDPRVHWNTLYLAGQAARHLNRLADAERYLRAAVDRGGGGAAPVLNALGIVLQLRERYADAVQVFRQSLSIEKDNDAALNSLALTYRKMNRLDDALAAYEKALTALVRRLGLSLENRPDNEVVGFEETTGQLWVKKAIEMATFIAVTIEGISAVSMPTAASAAEETRTKAHRGLLWQVRQDGSGKTVAFLPNFFDTARKRLRDSQKYAVMLNNLGGVLSAMGRRREARDCFLESIEFTPPGFDYAAPRRGLASLQDQDNDRDRDEKAHRPPGGSPSAAQHDTPSYVPGRPDGARVRTWLVVTADGKHFGSFDVFQSGTRYQLLSVKGLAENQLCVVCSEDGRFRTLKTALHGALMSLMPLIAFVFMSKLKSENTGEPWTIRNPDALNIVDISFVDQTGGAFPLGQVYFDEERLEVIETLIIDPDTGQRLDPPCVTVHMDANG